MSGRKRFSNNMKNNTKYNALSTYYVLFAKFKAFYVDYLYNLHLYPSTVKKETDSREVLLTDLGHTGCNGAWVWALSAFMLTYHLT